MNSVFFSIALSLDGYMVPKDMDFAHADMAETIASPDVTHLRYTVNG